MAKHKPLPGVRKLGPKRKAWHNSPVVDPSSNLEKARADVIADVFSNTPKPSDPSKSLSRAYRGGDKVHDNESQLVADLVKSRYGTDFFAEHPLDASNPLRERRIVEEVAKDLYKKGERSYGKPNLRKKKHRLTSGGSSTP